MAEKKSGHALANKQFVDRDHDRIPIKRQCELLGLNRSNLYYKAAKENCLDLRLMKEIDKIYTDCPFYGSRRITAHLNRDSININRKHVQRLMRKMGLEAIYPKPKTTLRNREHKVYPYLLRDLLIDRPNHVWSTDITYIPLQKGFMYLTAIIDWYSRYVISWRLSNTMDNDFCIEALEEALAIETPLIFNTDQGAQFTSKEFTGCLERAEVKISMDGKGRALDNIFVERLWRSVKYENIYLKDYQSGSDLYQGMEEYFSFYNNKRLHQSLGYKAPIEVHCC